MRAGEGAGVGHGDSWSDGYQKWWMHLLHTPTAHYIRIIILILIKHHHPVRVHISVVMYITAQADTACAPPEELLTAEREKEPVVV
jgi:hypothetical protein